MRLSGSVGEPTVAIAWSRLWFGKMMGILVIAPLVIAWLRKDAVLLKAMRRAIETLFVFTLLISVTYFVFRTTSEFSIQLSYGIIPLLIWLVFRSSAKAATLAVLIVSAIALWGIRNGHGPAQMKESVLLMEVLLACIQFISLVLIAHQFERRSAEHVLRRQEAKSRSLVERVPAIVYQVHFGSTVEWHYVSPRIQSILGFTAEEWIAGPQLWFKQIHPDDREEVLAKGMNSSLSGKPFTCEYRMFTRDGRLVWFRDEGNVIKDPERKSAMIQGVMLDITERKRTEILQNVLYKLAERTTTSQTLTEYCSLVHSSVSELMDARNFYIGLFEPVLQSFSFPYLASERTFSMDPENSMRGLPGYVLLKGPLLADAEKLAQLTRKGEIQDDGVPFTSWLGVPLKSHDRTLGILSVQSFAEDKKYSHTDLSALQLIGNDVAASLDQKRSAKALHEKSVQLQAINRAIAIFWQTGSWKSAGNFILQFVIQETKSRYGLIALRQDSGFVIAALQTASREEVQTPQIGNPASNDLNHFFNSVLKEARPLIWNDPENDPRATLLSLKPPFTAFVAVPLKRGDQVIGLIGLANRQGGYTETEVEKIETLCPIATFLYYRDSQPGNTEEQRTNADHIPEQHFWNAARKDYAATVLTILLVEDNGPARKATAALLIGRGFEVLEAANAPEALVLAEKHSGRIDLLITDVIMPEMNGVLLAQKLLAMRPKAKVLFTSGYAERDLAATNPEATFLHKPFSAGSFLGRIKELLDLSDLPF